MRTHPTRQLLLVNFVCTFRKVRPSIVPVWWVHSKLQNVLNSRSWNTLLFGEATEALFVAKSLNTFGKLWNFMVLCGVFDSPFCPCWRGDSLYILTVLEIRFLLRKRLALGAGEGCETDCRITSSRNVWPFLAVTSWVHSEECLWKITLILWITRGITRPSADSYFTWKVTTHIM